MSVEATAPLQNAAPNPPPVILIVPQPPILCRFYWMGCRELGSICCGGAALNTANGPWCRGVGVTMVWGGGVWGVMRMGMMGSIGAGKYSWIPFCANHTSGPRDKYICEAQVDVYARIQAQSFAVHSQYIHRFICNGVNAFAYENFPSSLLVQNHDLMGFNWEGLDYLKLYDSIIHTMRHLW